ncbi:secondary thiamine-phosphate synthase enzyme YjbQ [uncultured Bilophila sp.]|uniref:secondary thiamine-phosphate synthase enzyme YjbQ n=1 Tax=uncultured Bilophila sp. TaxID=529385 RepID=UPI0025F0859C|nr:secondary thiamine-phosphate synthase enzyme YjbQ [uncultured Bilophila sp.]
METCSVSTGRREEMIDVTERLREVVRRKGWRRGALAVFCPHTTCGLTINEGADPDVRRDMTAFLTELVPLGRAWRHAEGNSDAHVKASLMGPSLLLIVEEGDIRLGTWQSVYLCEGDGPRTRSLWLQWLPGEEGAR